MTQFAVYDTPFGFFKIGQEDNAIVLLRKVTASPIQDFGVPTPLTDLVHSQLLAYFAGNRSAFDFPYELQGTDFQKQVWQALCEIPYGETRSYGDIAQAIGNPKACRAVGMANNKNPIQIVVPCHRVVGANGNLVGYAGGLSMKQKLLDLELQHK